MITKASPFALLFLSLAACMAEPGQGVAPPSDAGVAAQADGGMVTARFHEEGFFNPAIHGLKAKLQELDCKGCHGADLTGGLGPSCDSCHPQNWRTTCTFCHGSKMEDISAPPRDIRGTTDPEMISFRAHRIHVAETDIKVAFDCVQCHVKPTDILSPGHIFVGDTTPGKAEVDFSGGLSANGTYDGNGGCANLYCHGNGLGDNGSAIHTMDSLTCTSCHPGPRTGAHRKHLEEGARCSDCHGDTATGSTQIRDLTLHVNKMVDLRFPDGLTRTNARCNGTCHIDGESENHNSRQWIDDDN